MKLTAFPVMRIFIYSLCFLIGALFLFSAFTKIFPVEYFEYTFVDLGFGNWVTAPFFARILISIEAFTGLLLILQIRMKKFTLPFAAVLLIIFSLHLVGQLLLNGNKGNCGCFGNYIFMTPLQALIKNILTLGLVFISYLLYSKGWQLNRYFVWGIFLIVIVTPFIVNPVDISVSASHDEEAVEYPIDIHWLYENPNDRSPEVDLTKGKHLIGFFSLTCEHCKLAAYKLHVMYKRNPSLPIYLVMNGDKDELAAFYDETKADNVPSVLFKGINFLKMSGPNLPVIYWVDNGIVVKKVNYMLLDQNEIENWAAGK